MKISLNDLKKFQKQIILKNIGIKGQKKIIEAKVLVVGSGGLGCPLLIYLANSGVGNLGIVDDDKIELSNLNRQTLFNAGDIKKFKVFQAKKVLKKINKKIKIKVFKQRLTIKNIDKILNKFDIICDGTDNYQTRYLINDYCLDKKKILISAAISKFDGHLFKFNFKKKSPCFRCFMPAIPEIENNCDSDGILSPVAGIMGSLQANEVLKTILGFEESLNGKILLFDGLKTSFRFVKITKNPRCINKC